MPGLTTRRLFTCDGGVHFHGLAPPPPTTPASLQRRWHRPGVSSTRAAHASTDSGPGHVGDDAFHITGEPGPPEVFDRLVEGESVDVSDHDAGASFHEGLRH